MSIGETLARARRKAGLSVAELSMRTRISQSVIDDIEHDDYSASGGESPVRADIAAIARALRIDSGPLIDAFDAGQRPGEWITAAQPPEPAGAAQEPEEVRWLQQPEPVRAEEDIQPLTDPDLAPLADPDLAPPVTAKPALADRRQSFWLVLGAGLVVVAAIGGILFFVGTSGSQRQSVAAGGRSGGGTTSPSRAGHAKPGHSASPAGRTQPAAHGASRPVQVLAPAGIAAFGPGGTGQGDSPQLARQALAGKSAAPWHSSWYTTATFGNLQDGTGLLLDMGRPVTITSAQIALGTIPGANLTLRIGDAPALASLRPTAHARGAAGLVRLTTAPTRGRYVLVWFTRLPPDHAGTFQVLVHDITLRGYR